MRLPAYTLSQYLGARAASALAEAAFSFEDLPGRKIAPMPGPVLADFLTDHQDELSDIGCGRDNLRQLIHNVRRADPLSTSWQLTIIM